MPNNDPVEDIKSISYFPYPIGTTTYYTPEKYILDLAKELYVNYIITNPETDSYRAISYAYTFWTCIPDEWKKSIVTDSAQINVDISIPVTPGNPTP